jgi:hypothetical protein
MTTKGERIMDECRVSLPVKTSSCPGCGAVLPEAEGPTHEYIGASPACWSIYSQVLAREYGDHSLFQKVHRLTVDAYAAQHPGQPSPQSIQSVAVHLMSLCSVLGDGSDAGWASKVIREGVRTKCRFSWLPPPLSMGPLIIVDVWEAKDASEHEKRAGEWASSVWEAWSAHHATIRRWRSSLQKPGKLPTP